MLSPNRDRDGVEAPENVPGNDSPTANTFWAGLTQPSVLSVSTLLVTAVALLGILSWWAPRWHDAGLDSYLAASDSDDYLFLTARARRLGESHPPTAPGVVVLGSSSHRLSLSSEEDMANSFEAAAGFRPRVTWLMAADASILEQVALAEHASRGFEGVILFGVNPLRLALTEKQLEEVFEMSRLGFTSELFDEAAEFAKLKVPLRTGVYAWDHRRFLLARVGRFLPNLLTGGHELPNHPGTVRHRQNKKERKRFLNVMRIYCQRYKANARRNLESVERLLDHVSSERRRVVLFEAPVDPGAFRDGFIKRTYAWHHERMSRFARRQGVLYVNVNERAKLEESDFFDWVHIRLDGARERYTRVIVEAVTPVLRELRQGRDGVL